MRPWRKVTRWFAALAPAVLLVLMAACDTDDGDEGIDLETPQETAAVEDTETPTGEGSPTPDIQDALDLSDIAAQLERQLEELERRLDELSEEQLTATFETLSSVCRENERRLEQAPAVVADALRAACDRVDRALEDGRVTGDEVRGVLDALEEAIPSRQAVEFAVQLTDRSEELLERLQAGEERQAEQLEEELARACQENLGELEADESGFVQELRDICDRIQRAAEEEGVSAATWRDIRGELDGLLP